MYFVHGYFWLERFLKNRIRDEKVEAGLRSLAWSVLAIWECQVKKKGNPLFRVTNTN